MLSDYNLLHAGGVLSLTLIQGLDVSFILSKWKLADIIQTEVSTMLALLDLRVWSPTL